MSDDELYDLLVQAHQAGQGKALTLGFEVSMRHRAALDHADRVLADLKEKTA
jgi:hypothetical protein